MLVGGEPVQEVDVPEGETQDLVLAELPVGGVSGQEAPQLGERPVDVLLPPALTAVGEDPATGDDPLTWRGGEGEEGAGFSEQEPMGASD